MSKIMEGISPLPWKNDDIAPTLIRDADGLSLEIRAAPYNAVYTVHACNLYPELVRLLVRYRNETPLGNQPHMIAHEVDEILAKCKAGET
jgi:hypothetical protein